MSDEELVLVSDHGDYAVVTLNRPDKRNAISRELAARLREALRALEDRKLLVLTGNGKAFCAGIDLGQRAEKPSWSETLGAHDGQFWFDTLEAIRRHPAVILAAVNGYALGAGLSMVNVSELAIAADTAEFGMPEMGFGSFPALSGPSTLQRVLPKHAAQMIFTAKRVGADVALRWGLVNELVPAAGLLDRAHKLAGTISSHDARTLAFGKRAVGEIQRMGWTESIDHGILVSAMVRRMVAE